MRIAWTRSQLPKHAGREIHDETKCTLQFSDGCDNSFNSINRATTCVLLAANAHLTSHVTSSSLWLCGQKALTSRLMRLLIKYNSYKQTGRIFISYGKSCRNAGGGNNATTRNCIMLPHADIDNWVSTIELHIPTKYYATRLRYNHSHI